MLSRQFLALIISLGKCFPVLRICNGVDFVSFCLSCLCKQNKRCRISCLETEGQIEEYERIKVELGESEDIRAYPDCYDNSLGHEKNRGSKESCEGLCLQGKPIVTVNRSKVKVWQMKSEEVLVLIF